MSAQNWQAPMHFDLDALLDNNDKPRPAKKDKTAAKAKPVEVKAEKVAEKPAAVEKPVAQEKSAANVAKPVEKTAEKKTEPAVLASKVEEKSPEPIALAAAMPLMPNLDDKPATTVQVSYQKPLEIPLEELASPEAKDTAECETNPYRKPMRFDSQTVLKPASAMAKSTAKTAKSLGKSTWQQSQQILNKLRAEDFPLWSWLLASLASFIVLLSIVDAVVFIDTWLSKSWLLGGIFSLLLIGIFALTIRLSYKLWQEISRMRVLSEWQQRGKTYQNAETYGHALAHVTHISQIYQQREDVQSNLETFYRTVNSSHTDAEVCQLYSQQVLAPLDEQAYQMVCRHAGQTALLVTLSPIPILSSLMTLWRNLALIRDVSSLYGGRPSFMTSGRLFVSVIHGLLYADVSEMVADSMAESVGGGVMAVFSAQIAQGIGSSMMTGRVGIQAMNLCRPLNFEADKRPRLAHVRKQTLGLLKQKLSQKTASA